MLPCKQCGQKTRVTNHYRRGLPNTIRYRKCTACGHSFVTAELYEWEYKGQPEPSDVRWERRRREKIYQREEREQKRREQREFCRKTNCLECPLPDCVEE